jgi:hypothetical protein
MGIDSLPLVSVGIPFSTRDPTLGRNIWSWKVVHEGIIM